MGTVERFYDTRVAEEWQRLAFEREPHRWLEFRVAMHLLDRHLPPAPARALDVGGGPGRYTIHYVLLCPSAGTVPLVPRRRCGDTHPGGPGRRRRRAA